ncbi:MAG: YciI family protein [Actinomycetota bacterium]
MRYLALIYGDESAGANTTQEQMQEIMDAYNAFGKEAAERGVLLGGEALEPTSTATTVRVRDEETLTTDGPFAETKEQLGGYYLLDCTDLDDALSWAKRVPMPGGTVEVRPVMDYDAAGSELHSHEPRAEARR